MKIPWHSSFNGLYSPDWKTLSRKKYKPPWTMRHNGVLGRQHWQACYSVPFIDIQDIFIPRKLWYSSPRCVIITISREYDKRSKFSPFQENCWSYRTCFLLFSETFFFQLDVVEPLSPPVYFMHLAIGLLTVLFFFWNYNLQFCSLLFSSLSVVVSSVH